MLRKLEIGVAIPALARLTLDRFSLCRVRNTRWNKALILRLPPLPPISELRQHGLPFGLAEIPPSSDLVQGSQATPAEARSAVYATDTNAGRRGFGGSAVHAKNTRSRELRETLPLVSSASMK